LMTKPYHPNTDCNEIADMMRKAANGEGDIVHATPNKRGDFNFYEDSLPAKFDYHDFYIDSNFAYDPRLRARA
jgi:hypothetical protein